MKPYKKTPGLNKTTTAKPTPLEIHHSYLFPNIYFN